VPSYSQLLTDFYNTCENIVEYRRTAVIKLDTPEGADEYLRETVEQFKYCANTASEWCWHGDDGYHVTSKAKAGDVLYD
jgi:putative transposase